MKKILLITLIFILQSFPTFGSSLDGKRLMCENINKEFVNQYGQITYYLGVVFEDNMVSEIYFRQKDDGIVGFQSNNYDYQIDDKSILWINILRKRYVIDRKTLGLSQYDGNDEKNIRQTHQCELVDRSEYNDKVKSVFKHLHSIYDERTKDNKI